MIKQTFITCLIGLSALFSAATLKAEPVQIDRIIAIVNNEAISESELQNELQSIKLQLKGRQMPADSVLREQVSERLIMKHLQQQLGNSNNIIVDDETLNQALNSISKQNNISLERLRAVLESDGINFNTYRENIRHEILLQRLRQRHINTRINITETEVDQFLAQQKTQGNSADEFRLGHILIGLPEAPSAEDINKAKQHGKEVLTLLAQGEDFSQTAMSHSDGQNALSGGDLGWRKAGELPSLFAKAITTMQADEVSPLIRSPSGFHIIKISEQRGGERHMVSQTLARHILIKTNELVDDEAARSRLLELKNRLENGDDFATLARANSDDKGSAAKGGDLSWSSPGQMVPAFEEMMNKLELNVISEPFQTQFGWHIVEVLERRQHDDTDKFYRNQARKQLFERKAAEEEELWLRRMRDEAYIELQP